MNDFFDGSKFSVLGVTQIKYTSHVGFQMKFHAPQKVVQQ